MPPTKLQHNTVNGFPTSDGIWASLVTQMVKRLPAMREIQVRSLGQEEPLEKEMETHSSTLAWWATVHGVAKSWTRLSDFTHSQ